MAKYRKKPVVIEAFLFQPHMHATELPDWARNLLGHYPERFNPETGEWKIHTLEGVMVAKPGDYIIQGVAGEVYPCKPGIFEETYEAVEE